MASYVSNASGNWSDATKWTPNGVPGDGDFASIGHAIVINQNIGTNGNGIKRITITAGSLSFDAATNRIIYFGSTGTDPIGSGSAAAPANDATMFGFFNNYGGTITLVGSPSAILTITTGNNSSPWYLYNQMGGANFSFRYVDSYHMGTTSVNFRGLEVGTGYQNFTVAIDHNRFTDYYEIVLLGVDDTAYAINFNMFTAGRASGANGHISGAGRTAPSLSISDNTLTAPVNDAYFIILNNLPNGSLIRRNALFGTPTAMVSLGLFASGSGHSILNNLVVNSNSASGLNGMSAQTNTTTTQGNYFSGQFLAGIDIGNQTGSLVTANFLSQEGYAWFGQGNIFGASVASTTISYNVMVNETANLVQASESMLLWNTNVNSNLVNHNTVLGPPCLNGGARSANSLGISFGEPSASGTLNIFRNNFVCGWVNGYYDDANVAYAADFSGVGVHHNAFYDNTAHFLTPNGNGEANFGTAHPNAAYGEVVLSSSPAFVDPLRRLATWDAELGGPGTNANAFTELSKRSGFGGSYNSDYNIPDLMTYVLAGFSPTNSALAGAASDGTDIGAVAVTASASGGLSRVLGMFYLDSLN